MNKLDFVKGANVVLMIEIKNLYKTFQTKDGKVEALKNVNITVNDGDIYGIIGMSGAGKTQVMHSLEDMGYYCIDNMPVAFLLPFAKMCNNESDKFENVAVVVDIRGGDALSEIGTALESFEKNNISYEILFLEADESVIVKRYKETRRMHPLSPKGSIE